MSFLGTRNAVSIGVSPHVTLGGPNLLNKLSPSLLLNFAGAETLDPRITFTRATTATFTGSNGLIQTAAIDAPRFDYNPTTLAPLGLLIEEQRTNLLPYSQQFDNAAWTKTRSSITADATTSPDGTVDADKLVEDTTASSTHSLAASQTTVSGTSYSYSIFAKVAERTSFSLQLPSTLYGASVTASFNLSAQTTTIAISGTSTAASITPVGNGWFRCVLTSQATASATASVLVTLENTPNNRVYTGDGFSGLYIWGAQLEAGAFRTSYIPTVASQVTRSADVAVMTGTNFSDWYNQAQGTLYAEGSWVGLLTSRQAVIINNSASQSTDFISIQTNPSTATTGRGGVTVGGTARAAMNIINAYTANVLFKAANAYQQDNFAFTVGGSTPATDTFGILPIVNQMQLGAISATTSNIWLRQIVYYPRRLANSELQAITA